MYIHTYIYVYICIYILIKKCFSLVPGSPACLSSITRKSPKKGKKILIFTTKSVNEQCPWVPGSPACSKSFTKNSKQGRKNEYMNSLLCLECHFFNLKSQLMIWFFKSLLPPSVKKRPERLRLEIYMK